MEADVVGRKINSRLSPENQYLALPTHRKLTGDLLPSVLLFPESKNGAKASTAFHLPVYFSLVARIRDTCQNCLRGVSGLLAKNPKAQLPKCPRTQTRRESQGAMKDGTKIRAAMRKRRRLLTPKAPTTRNNGSH